MFEKNHQKSLPSQRNIFLSTNIEKKMSPQGQTSFSQKNTVHRRRGVWRILMNYIQPNAGQTTHSIYTLIQDGAQYVPLKCRKARRVFYWTKKNGGWLRYFNISRRISSSFLLLLWESDRVFEKRKAVCTCICLTLNTRLREFYKNTFLKLFFCVCSNWPMRTWTYFAVGSCPLRDWIAFLCSTFYSGLSNCFLKH